MRGLLRMSYAVSYEEFQARLMQCLMPSLMLSLVHQPCLSTDFARPLRNFGSQKSYACLVRIHMRSYAELAPACGPAGRFQIEGPRPAQNINILVSIFENRLCVIGELCAT